METTMLPRYALTTKLYAWWLDKLIILLVALLLVLPSLSFGNGLRPSLTILQTAYPTVMSEILDTDTSFAVKTVTPSNDYFSTTKTVFGITYTGTLILSFDAFVPYNHPSVGERIGYIRVTIGNYNGFIPIHHDQYQPNDVHNGEHSWY
jgi:hypothetical protein